MIPDQGLVVRRETEGLRRAELARVDLGQFLAGRQVPDVNQPITAVVPRQVGEVLPSGRNEGVLVVIHRRRRPCASLRRTHLPVATSQTAMVSPPVPRVSKDLASAEKAS